MPDRYILFCTPFFREPGEGAATGGLLSNFHLVRALAANHKVRVLSLDASPPSERIAASVGYEVMSVPAKVYRRGLNYLFWRRDVLAAVSLAVRRWGEPALLLATSSTVHTLRDVNFDGLKKIAILRAYENFGLRVPEGQARERLSAFQNGVKQQVPQGRALRMADRLIVNSRYMADQARQVFGQERSEVLYPCIDVASIVPFQDANAVGFVNRGGSKGLDLVVRLAERLPGASFKVFGSATPLENALPNLTFMGWSDNREAMFSAAPLWIAPSRWNEPFGRVAAEAQACGRQVIVSRRGGLPEAVVEPGDVIDGFEVETWASRIAQALERPLGEADAQALSRRSQARFGIESHDRRVAEILSAVL